MDLVLGALLSVGLSGLGVAIAMTATLTSYASELNEILDEKKKENVKADFQKKIMIYGVMYGTAPLFAFAILFMIAWKDLPDDLFIAICLNIGISGMLMCLAEGYYVRANMKAALEDHTLWSKSIVGLAFFEIPLMWSFAIAFLTMPGFEGYVVQYVQANIVIAVASIGSLISAALMLRVDLKDLRKRTLTGLPGIIVSMMGLVLALLLMGFPDRCIAYC